MHNRKLNEAMAQIILRHKLTTKEIIQDCLSEVSEARDIGQVLVINGHLKQPHYDQIRNYLRSLQTTQIQTPAEEPATGPQPTATNPPQFQRPAAEPQPTVAAPTQVSQPKAEQPPISQEKGHKEPAQESGPKALPDEFRQNPGQGKLNFPMPEKITPQSTLEEILVMARRARASDVHLSTQSPVIFRRYGKLIQGSDWALSPRDIENLVSRMIPESDLKRFKEAGDLETSHTIPGGGRFRITMMEQRFGWDFSARVIPYDIRPFEDSGLPDTCKVLTTYAQGMVLITGPMGCGKSSTLCTMIEMINQDRHDHIITVENPIEYIFEGKKCQITQREVGVHTLSQGNALKGALRQDPDILIVSELRDLDSMRLAITAAETGHLVLATMNTANATRTIDRLIDTFPPEERDITRNMVSESLRGVISQQLIPRKDGKGVIPCFEILMVTQAVSNLIRKNNTNQLESAMVSGRSLGMITLDNALEDLVKKDLIEGLEAYHRATTPKRFIQFAPAGTVEVANG